MPVPGVDIDPIRGHRGTCRHPQGRICDNLKYGLQQMKYRGQKDAYKAVIEAIAVGPEVVRTAEVKDILGLNPETILKARARHGISIDDELDTQTSGIEFEPYEEKRGRGQRGPRLGLRELFVYYARLGEHGASGKQISLNQSDKWLKQSDVIDNWNVTTTDTAIAFRKISR